MCWAETKWSRWEHAPLCLHWIWVCRDTQTHAPTHTFPFAHTWSLNNSQALVWRGNTGIVQQLSLACQNTDYRFYWGSPVTLVSCFICLSQFMLHYKSKLILMFSFFHPTMVSSECTWCDVRSVVCLKKNSQYMMMSQVFCLKEKTATHLTLVSLLLLHQRFPTFYPKSPPPLARAGDTPVQNCF